VKIGGVTIGQVSEITLDPAKFDSIVTLAIDKRYADLPVDTSAGILTGGLLGESYVGLQPGGDVEVLKPGEEIAFTTPAVDLMQLVGKYMFGGGGSAGAGNAAPAAPTTPQPAPAPQPGNENNTPSPTEPTP